MDSHITWQSHKLAYLFKGGKKAKIRETLLKKYFHENDVRDAIVDMDVLSITCKQEHAHW
jgi:hypothetical protein